MVRKPSECATAVDFFPVVAGALQAGNLAANFVVENFSAAAGNGLQPGVHQALNGFADAQFADFRDAQNFRRGKTVQMHLRKARLQRAQEIFVVADLQVGMQAALQQNSRSAELEHLFDFFVNRLEGEDVTVFRAERPVKRAERTVFRAEIRVINVAVDLVGDDARIIFLQAHLVRGHADAHQVVGLQHVESFLFRQSHVVPFCCIILILTDASSNL